MDPGTAIPPFYADWKFWSVIVSLIAIGLSQLPPVVTWFKRPKLRVEVHSRLLVNHVVGNPNISLVVGIENIGGRTLRVEGANIDLAPENKTKLSLPAQGYYETATAKESVLFVPFHLASGERWSHSVNFVRLFDRAIEKQFRASASALKADIHAKIAARDKTDDRAVEADSSLVQPFKELFKQHFMWEPGEYEISLTITTDPPASDASTKYRFTLFESDAVILKDHVEAYKYGAGINYFPASSEIVSVPLVKA